LRLDKADDGAGNTGSRLGGDLVHSFILRFAFSVDEAMRARGRAAAYWLDTPRTNAHFARLTATTARTGRMRT
ncbi:MAG: hypothetical protein KAI98_01110, partial [Gemmatimonadetes bacterium]|nr:hypothetical protein [Gemmatimonadota bacterium]